MIDAFSHLDHFIDYAGKHGSLIKIMGTYYAYRGVAFFDRTSGVLTLIAVMFTVTWIRSVTDEIDGTNRGRYLEDARAGRPVLMAAVCVSLAAAANRELVMPNIRDHLATDSKNIGGDQVAAMQSRFDSETNILIGGDKIVPAENKIVGPAFVLPRQFDQFGKQVTAAEARFMPAEGDRPSGYLLCGVNAPRRRCSGVPGYCKTTSPSS